MDKLLNATIQLIGKGSMETPLWFATSGGILCGDVITDPNRALEKIFLLKPDGALRETQEVPKSETSDGDPLIFLENAKLIILGQSLNVGTAVIHENQVAAWGFGLISS